MSEELNNQVFQSRIKKLSSSALDRFTQCPKSYFHDYLDPNPPEKGHVRNFYAHYGTLIHFFAEMYPRTNSEHGFDFEPSRVRNDGSLEDVLNIYGNQLMEKKIPLDVQKMIAIYDAIFPMIQFETENAKNEYYLQGYNFIEKIPSMDWSNVTGLEQRFRVDLGNGVVPITGIIDKVERDEKGLVITDYKTSKPYTIADINKKNQLPIYGMASFFLYDELPYKYRYHFTRFDKIVEVEIPIERLTDVKNQIRFKYAQMITFEKLGQFPAIYNDFFCKSFCPFKDSCETFQQYNN